MRPLRVLITNITLATRSGTETYVRDLALNLARRGHRPCVYTPDPGPIAEELRGAGVEVAGHLRLLTSVPDLIHGHHQPETMAAMLHFPGVPGLFVLHDRLAWHDEPPVFPRIRRHVAVDENCRERLVENGIPPERIRVIFNSVDLDRFPARRPLPWRPARALVFSNTAMESTHLPVVREACTKAGIAVDVLGAGVGRVCEAPEKVLGQYDLVFAKARAALEAMAAGTAVVLCDARGVGPMVSSSELDRLRPLNFGMKTLGNPLHAEVVAREIARYDAADAAEVSRRIRSEAGVDTMVDALLAVYEEILGEPARSDASEEGAAAAAYVRSLERISWENVRTRQERDAMRAQLHLLQAQVSVLQDSRPLRIWRRLRNLPLMGSIARLLGVDSHAYRRGIPW